MEAVNPEYARPKDIGCGYAPSAITVYPLYESIGVSSITGRDANRMRPTPPFAHRVARQANFSRPRASPFLPLSQFCARRMRGLEMSDRPSCRYAPLATDATRTPFSTQPPSQDAPHLLRRAGRAAFPATGTSMVRMNVNARPWGARCFALSSWLRNVCMMGVPPPNGPGVCYVGGRGWDLEGFPFMRGASEAGTRNP